MSQRSEALAELRTLHKSPRPDVLALRQLVRHHGDELAQAAGVKTEGVLRLVESPSTDLVRGASKVLELARHRNPRLRSESALERADTASAALQDTACWAEEEVQLDVRIVLGELLAAPARYIAFEQNDTCVVVEKARLAALRRLARRLPGLRVSLSSHALSFRWNQGRGGLDLHCERVLSRSSSDVYNVALHRPARAPVKTPPQRGAFIGHVLEGVMASLHRPLH